MALPRPATLSLALLAVLPACQAPSSEPTSQVVLDDESFAKLTNYLGRVPSIQEPISHGSDATGWWVKFSLNLDHPRAWQVVQELGHVLNYLSIDERLPTVFKPVSPPPYLNGGPRDYLAWVIEAETVDFRPDTCAEWLEGRLPKPVDDDAQWANDG